MQYKQKKACKNRGWQIIPYKYYFWPECWCRTPLLIQATVVKNSFPGLSDFQSSGLFQRYAWGRYQHVSTRGSKSLNPDEELESTPTVSSCGHMPPPLYPSSSAAADLCCVYLQRMYESRVSYPTHGRSEAVGEFAQRAQILLEALQLSGRRCWGRALLRGSRRTNLLLSPQTGARHQQQITQ